MKIPCLLSLLILSLYSLSQPFNRPLYVTGNAHEAAVLTTGKNTYITLSESMDDSVYYTVIYKLNQMGNILASDTVDRKSANGPQSTLGSTYYSDMVLLSDSTFILFGTYNEECVGPGTIGGFVVNYDKNLTRLHENSFQDYAFQNYDFVVLDSGGYALHGTNSLIKLAPDLTIVKHYIDSTVANDLESIHLPGDWFYSIGGYVPITDTSFVRNIHTGAVLSAPRLEGNYLDITDTTFILGTNSNWLILYDKRNFQKLDSIKPYNALGFGLHWSTISYRSEEIILKEYQGKRFGVISKSDLSVIGIDSMCSDGWYLNFRGGMCYYDSTLVFGTAMSNGQVNVESFLLNKPKAPGFESLGIQSKPFNFNIVSKDSIGVQTLQINATSEWKVEVVNNSRETIKNAAFTYMFDQQGMVCQGLRSLVEFDTLNILPGDTLQFTLGPLNHSSGVPLPGNFNYFMHIAPIMVNDNIITNDSLYAGYGVVKNISLFETEVLTRNLNLFPNPANDHVIVDFKRPFTGDVALIDTFGKVIFQERVSLASAGQFELNLQTYPGGIYILRFSDNNQTATKRLVIR